MDFVTLILYGCHLKAVGLPLLFPNVDYSAEPVKYHVFMVYSNVQWKKIELGLG